MSRISQNRAQVQGQQPLDQKGGPAKADPEKFAATLISDKVLKKHGAALAPAAGDMQAIAGALQGLASHRATQFTNAVDQFYSALGRSTDNLDPKTREDVVKASMGAMRGLVEELAQHPALMPAMAALSSLLEPRGELNAAAQTHADQAKAQVLDVVSRFEARRGTSSVLFGFRNLVEGYESRAAGLTARQRPGVWSTITDYLETTVPRPGCDQGQLGTITGLFMRALRETDDPKKALKVATAGALAPHADTKNATLEQLKVEPPNLQPNSPQKQAFAAMQSALQQVVADNPAGPPELFAAIDQVQGRLPQVAQQAANEDLAKGFENLARILEISGRTNAVITVLEHVGQQLPAMVTHAGSRNILAKAARIQKAESLAPLLVEAHLARINRNPQQMQLVEPLEKLKRLPPGPSLRAAVALLPQLQQAHAAPLAEALFVESRTAESSEALQDFVTRFSAAFPQLRNLGDGAGVVAAALARDGAGPVDANIARQLAQLVVQTKATLPETPRTKLLARGRNGEPGLIALANVKDYLHNPIPLANQLLQIVKQARPNQEAVVEARLALQIAGEVARFDRNPAQTDFPKITEDFRTALQNPAGLTGAKGAGRPGGAPKSALAFAAAHPEFPVEVLFTAAQMLGEAEMTWLQSELTSTRSNDYRRVLRDAIYAASKTGRADFFTALATSPADRKAKEAAATTVALDHRQGHAANVAWDLLIEGLGKGENPVARIEADKAAEAMQAIGLDGIAEVDPVGIGYLERSKKPLQAMLNFFGNDQYGKPKDFFLEPLMAAVKAQADGSWPAPKYESESAKEHLAPLRPEQLEAWKRNTVSGADAAPVAVDDPEQIEALQLLQGVAKTFTEHVQIGGEGFENVEFDAKSLADLTKQRDALLVKLRDSKKGSPDHRKLSREIGPLQQRVALLELHAGLMKDFGPEGQPAADPAKALAAIKPLAQGAMSALRKQGAHGFVQALDTAAAAVKGAPAASPRSGNYACDDDTLDAYLTAFGGGCIHPENGFNRGSLVELITGSQYKMIRAMRGDKSVGRSFLRLVRVEMANGYKGMALRMDPPQASSGGNPAQNERAMMYKHALGKAMSMGVPLMVSDNTVAAAAQEAGLKLEQQATKTFVHQGVTGMHHNQGMWNADYFIAWQGVNVGQGGPKPALEDKECGRDYSFQVVMPPGFQPA